MPHTTADTRLWWLRMASRYDAEAARLRTPAQRADYERRAASARAQAETYTAR